jgi:ABC-type lipoprotein release transport system permease subunit
MRALLFWSKVAFLFLVRTRRSTVTLSLMVTTAVATLIFLSALAVGVNDAMVRNSVSLYAGHITGFDLPAAIDPQRLMVAGVQSVLKRTACPGILSSPTHLETAALIGIDPAAELSSTALPKKMLAGGYPRPGEQALLLSKPLAEALGVQAGDGLEFSTGSLTALVRFRVAGIYRTGIEQLDRGIAFCPLDALPCPAATWSAAVFLQDGIEPETVIVRYRRQSSLPCNFKTWSELLPDLRQLIDLNYVSMSIVTILVFGVVSLGIACAFVIFILKHLREYGIMKAMGVTAREMVALIILEVVLMNLMACCAGIAAGVLASVMVSSTGIDLTAFTSHNRYFAVSGIIYPRLTAFSLCTPPALALLFSLAAAVWPAVLVARTKTADILRVL